MNDTDRTETVMASVWGVIAVGVIGFGVYVANQANESSEARPVATAPAYEVTRGHRVPAPAPTTTTTVFQPTPRAIAQANQAYQRLLEAQRAKAEAYLREQASRQPQVAPPASPAADSGYPAWQGYDLDCADIGHPVIVNGPDPHGLDGDNDGVGCE